MEQTTPKPNLFVELAKRKAEAQKARANSASKLTSSGKSQHSTKGLLGPSWGGRNGQGKP